jgi:hypothetical protein
MSNKLTQIGILALLGAVVQLTPVLAKGDDAKSKEFATTNCQKSANNMQAQPGTLLPIPWCSDATVAAPTPTPTAASPTPTPTAASPTPTPTAASPTPTTTDPLQTGSIKPAVKPPVKPIQ